MKTTNNSILEELWRTKDELAREAGADVHRLCENTRRWAAAHPHPGPKVTDAAELRAWLASQDEADSLVVRDNPQPRGNEPL